MASDNGHLSPSTRMHVVRNTIRIGERGGNKFNIVLTTLYIPRVSHTKKVFLNVSPQKKHAFLTAHKGPKMMFTCTVKVEIHIHLPSTPPLRPPPFHSASTPPQHSRPSKVRKTRVGFPSSGPVVTVSSRPVSQSYSRMCSYGVQPVPKHQSRDGSHLPPFRAHLPVEFDAGQAGESASSHTSQTHTQASVVTGAFRRLCAPSYRSGMSSSLSMVTIHVLGN